MIEVGIRGVGVWSNHFGNWAELCAGIESGKWPDTPTPTPSLLPPGIRRRAPLSVKMAVEVMQQACEMASMEPSQIATVYSSSFGDMTLTDRICRTLKDDPKLTSPTNFHNSVHNAATGYWTIATGAQRPANAISAFGPPPAVSLLEAASQAIFEETPVLLVFGEVQAPDPMSFTTSKQAPFAAATILAPYISGTIPLAKLKISLEQGRAEPIRDDRLPDGLGAEPDACLLTMLAALPNLRAGSKAATFRIGLSNSLQLRAAISLEAGAGA